MILLLPQGCFLSESSRMLAIHQRLQGRGADVVSATHGGSFATVYDDAGVDLIRMGSIDLERQRRLVASVPGMRGAPQDMWSVEELREQVRRELALIERVGASVLVTGWTLSALISSRVAGIPLIAEHAGSMLPPLFENDLVPLPSALPSPVLRLLPKPIATRALNRRMPHLRIHLNAINQVCAEYGVEEVPSFPALLMGDVSLVMDVPEMFGFSREEIDAWRPQHPASYREGARLAYGGPLFAQLDLPIPDEVDRFLDKEPVYVAMTSTPAAQVGAVVDRLRELRRPLLVSACGPDADALDALAGPDLMVAPILPHHRVVPRASLLVGAGGQGTVQAAMTAGVPLLGIPLQPEQDANVVLAQRRGAALRVGPRRAGTTTVVDAARRLLEDPSHRTAAAAMARAYAGVDGAAAAADVILRVAGSDPTSPASLPTSPQELP
ncbi:hypothetical protein GCM10022215_24530 [Nocardioides fonticola]|uniref:Glycosyltransferase n=1 Tax=Nocardioides fonticola TaxID=450363 RepID=A0ABP7XKY8_9ACTN